MNLPEFSSTLNDQQPTENAVTGTGIAEKMARLAATVTLDNADDIASQVINALAHYHMEVAEVNKLYEAMYMQLATTVTLDNLDFIIRKISSATLIYRGLSPEQTSRIYEAMYVHLAAIATPATVDFISARISNAPVYGRLSPEKSKSILAGLSELNDVAKKIAQESERKTAESHTEDLTFWDQLADEGRIDESLEIVNAIQTEEQFDALASKIKGVLGLDWARSSRSLMPSKLLKAFQEAAMRALDSSTDSAESVSDLKVWLGFEGPEPTLAIISDNELNTAKTSLELVVLFDRAFRRYIYLKDLWNVGGRRKQLAEIVDKVGRKLEEISPAAGVIGQSDSIDPISKQTDFEAESLRDRLVGMGWVRISVANI